MATLRSTTVFQAANPEFVTEWVGGLVAGRPHLDAKQLEQLCLTLLDLHASRNVPLSALQMGAKKAEILAELNLDLPTLMTALCYHTVREAQLTDEEQSKILPADVVHMIKGVSQMDAVNALRAEYNTPEHYQQQMNNVRQMLLAMAEDVRVVLIKLAEHLCLLEAATQEPVAKQRILAQQAREIYAPLANRLGVGHIKWQLEDWAFRYLEPDAYKQIAHLIAEKRLDRQKAVDDVIAQLDLALEEDGIQGEVKGRVKHIYSIWNKMRRKNIQYEEVYDVRALRILVDKISDCYGALGTVHRLWMHIPKEFDDYIAQPKPNGYRSLHTAVIGPGGKALEVQIRTREMHQESELGVCAHWAYKESATADPQLQHKIKWLRSLLEWQEEVTRADDVMSELKKNVAEERVYVFTPTGDVIDLPKGSTPLDFAYHVHTQLGHRTRGAKINGKIVPLTYQLNMGEQVEILSQKEPKPGRDWINPDSGYIYTSRARAKARSWFKLQHRDENIHDGKHLLEKEIHRLGVPDPDYDALCHRFNFVDEDDLFAALGRGDLRLSQIISASKPHVPEVAAPHPHKPPQEHHGSDAITIEGVGNLLTLMAGCCHALPGDPIIGFITHGRGVSIHRQDCSNILQAQTDTPERVIAVQWGKQFESVYAVQIKIFSYDRKNLLRDITSILAHESVNVIGIESFSDKHTNTVKTLITLEVPDLAKLARLLDHIKQLPNIISAQRVHQESSK